MKKIIFILLTLVTIQSFGQGGWLRSNTSFGNRQYRGSDDSTRFIPTGITPSLRLGTGGASANLHQGAVFMDSANHILWVYDPKRNTWDSAHLGASGGGGSDDLNAVLAIGNDAGGQDATNFGSIDATTSITVAGSGHYAGLSPYNLVLSRVNSGTDAYLITAKDSARSAGGGNHTYFARIAKDTGTIALQARDSSGSPINMVFQSVDGKLHKAAIPTSAPQDLNSVLSEGNDGGGQNITGVAQIETSDRVVNGDASTNSQMRNFAFILRKTFSGDADEYTIVATDSAKSGSGNNTYRDTLPKASGVFALQNWVQGQIHDSSSGGSSQMSGAQIVDSLNTVLAGINLTPGLSTSGNLGVGTTTPGGLIDVYDGSNSIFKLDVGNLYILFDENNSGYNVGIGTASPTEKLHVVGNGLFTGTVSASQGFIEPTFPNIDLNAGAYNCTYAGLYVVTTGHATNRINLPDATLHTGETYIITADAAAFGTGVKVGSIGGSVFSPTGIDITTTLITTKLTVTSDGADWR